MAFNDANFFKRWFSVFMGVFGAFVGGFGVYEIVRVGESHQGLIANQHPIQVVASASQSNSTSYVARDGHQSQVVLASAPHSGP
jgi:hypothetical protein